ncbi:MAG: hypothetical protein PHH41_11330 [Sulfurimonas sp.]|nr:hypothetical protein [Sulfurimonas sp.]MDD3060595.1 hypothetical protein [Sulfurimonas sp.]MDD5203716.1 hypothetical protein [Sulfurimonas sp.]
MNVIIEGYHLNGFVKERTDKKTGQIIAEYVEQIQQRKELPNGQIQVESFDIPLDISMQKQFAEKKLGDKVSVPCNVYGENFAQIKIGKAK